MKLKRLYTENDTKPDVSNTAPKTYWTILNRLFYNKKISAIPPVFVDGSFISDYCKKASIFNNFLASLYTSIKKNSVLPPLLYKTNMRISYFHVTNKDILSIIKSLALDSHESHGYDNVSVKMIKICSESVTIPSKIMFQESLKEEIFPEMR